MLSRVEKLCWIDCVVCVEKLVLNCVELCCNNCASVICPSCIKRVEFEKFSKMSNTRNDVDVTLQDSSASDSLKAIDSMKLFELKEELKKRKIKTSGDKKVLQDRLKGGVGV